jgi:hypothetical protein
VLRAFEFACLVSCHATASHALSVSLLIPRTKTVIYDEINLLPQARKTNTALRAAAAAFNRSVSEFVRFREGLSVPTKHWRIGGPLGLNTA